MQNQVTLRNPGSFVRWNVARCCYGWMTLIGLIVLSEQVGLKGILPPLSAYAACQENPATADSAARVAPPQGPVTAFVGANVRDGVTPGILENVTILVADGTIQQLGTDVVIPDEAKVVDWTGKTVLPGIVDPYYVDSSLRPSSGGGGPGRQINVGGRTVNIPGGGGATESTEFIRITDLWNPRPGDTRIALRSGVTTAHLVTSGYGQSVFTSPQLGQTTLHDAWGGRLFVAASPNTNSLEVIRRGFSGRPATPPATGQPVAGPPAGQRGRRPPRDIASVEAHGHEASGSDVAVAEFQEGDSAPAAANSGGAAGGASASDALWEEVRQGNQPVIINANNAASILHVLKIIKPAEKARVLLVANASDIYQVRDALRESRVNLIIRPRLEKVPNSAVRVNIAKELQQWSIPFSFSLSSNQADFQQSQDTPLFPVATLVRTGLAPDVAVQSLTMQPAKVLGVDKWVGSLEPKKHANLLVFDQDPLLAVGRLEQVYVEGKLVYEDRE